MSAVQTVQSRALVPIQRPAVTVLTAFRQPKTVDLSAMEEALRKGLEGKFFTVEGLDINALNEEDARLRAHEKREREERQRIAAEKLKAKVEAQRAAREALKLRSQVKNYTVGMVIEAVCYAHEVGGGELLGKSRRKAVVRARQHCAALLMILLKKSNTEIGRIFGRDHSTVIHAITTWECHRGNFQREIDVVNDVLGMK